MSEAVYLHKPLLSLPVQGQFEQTLNALYLQQLGYGHHAEVLDTKTLQKFLDDIPRCAEALKGYAQDGNRLMLEALDEQIALATSKK
jgi:UDP:flavonoid glycosyltransferase YjiC (YdhE family)